MRVASKQNSNFSVSSRRKTAGTSHTVRRWILLPKGEPKQRVLAALACDLPERSFVMVLGRRFPIALLTHLKLSAYHHRLISGLRKCSGAAPRPQSDYSWIRKNWTTLGKGWKRGSRSCVARLRGHSRMAGPRMRTRPRILRIALPAPTTRNFCSHRATTNASSCKWWKAPWCAYAKETSESASPAGGRSIPSAWKRCLGPATASNARRSLSRACWKKLRGRSPAGLFLITAAGDRADLVAECQVWGMLKAAHALPASFLHTAMPGI